MRTRALVKIEGRPGEPVLTYEVVGPVHVGDEVIAPIWDEPYRGIVVAIGNQSWDGRPPYLGPCKIATVVTGGTDASS